MIVLDRVNQTVFPVDASGGLTRECSVEQHFGLSWSLEGIPQNGFHER